MCNNGKFRDEGGLDPSADDLYEHKKNNTKQLRNQEPNTKKIRIRLYNVHS